MNILTSDMESLDLHTFKEILSRKLRPIAKELRSTKLQSQEIKITNLANNNASCISLLLAISKDRNMNTFLTNNGIGKSHKGGRTDENRTFIFTPQTFGSQNASSLIENLWNEYDRIKYEL